jgi:radical SAM protein with 4Fe4S-binding SPASM domain
MELFAKIVEESSKFASKLILQNRGEPLMHKNIVDMVSMANQAGLNTVFHTNASMLNEEVGGKLIDAGLNSMIISFNGETDVIHNQVSGSNFFEKSLNNTINFLKLMKKKQSSSPYVEIQVMKFEGEQGESGRFEIGKEFKDKFRDLPVKAVKSIWAINRSGETKKNSLLNINFTQKKYMPCRWIWSSIVVNWNGRVFPCCMDFNEDFPLGDVNTESIIDIWNNEKMQNLRKKLCDRKYKEIPLCAECDILWSVEEETSFAKNLLTNLISKHR